MFYGFSGVILLLHYWLTAWVELLGLCALAMRMNLSVLLLVWKS